MAGAAGVVAAGAAGDVVAAPAGRDSGCDDDGEDAEVAGGPLSRFTKLPPSTGGICTDTSLPSGLVSC